MGSRDLNTWPSPAFPHPRVHISSNLEMEAQLGPIPDILTWDTSVPSKHSLNDCSKCPGFYGNFDLWRDVWLVTLMVQQGNILHGILQNRIITFYFLVLVTSPPNFYVFERWKQSPHMLGWYRELGAGDTIQVSHLGGRDCISRKLVRSWKLNPGSLM